MMIHALLIAATIGFTVAGQIILKTQASHLVLPTRIASLPAFLLTCLQNPWLWVVVILAFLAMASWMAVLTRLPLSQAYPFTSLTYVLVLVLSMLLLHERPGWATIAGTAVILVGVALVSLDPCGTSRS